MSKVQIDASRCIGCGKCVKDCPVQVLRLEDGKAVFLGGRCFTCGHCLAVCPVSAVTLSEFSDGQPEAQMSLNQGPKASPSDLLGLMRSRRSTRQFKQEALSDEALAQLLAAAATAPTATNRQPLRYIILEKELAEAKALAADAFKVLSGTDTPYAPVLANMVQAHESGQDPLFFNAPQVLLVVHPKDSNSTDPALAAARVELMAESMGLGLCIVGFFVTAVTYSEPLRTFLGLADDEVLSLSMALGHPAVHYQRSVPRKPLNVLRR